MCAGHSLHRDDWLKLALIAGAGATGAGAVAGDAFLPGLLESQALEAGPGAAAGGLAGVNEIAAGAAPQTLGSALQTQAMNVLGGSGNYDKASGILGKFGKVSALAGKSGLLAGGQVPMQPVMPPPGGAGQANYPSSAQIRFPDAQQALSMQQLAELQRRRQLGLA